MTLPKMAREPISVNRTFEKIATLQTNVEHVIRGKSEVIQYCIAALLSKGHILLEDVPGVGKTTLAHALARSLSLSFQRIQFTSDLLPADIVGVTIYNQDQQEFEFISGPIFTNVLLADEINRATPKSQSALLEAMSEGMISIEKRRLPLPDPFLVIATQNPIEHVGTYPLPESQLDRFLMKLTAGAPSPMISSVTWSYSGRITSIWCIWTIALALRSSLFSMRRKSASFRIAWRRSTSTNRSSTI